MTIENFKVNETEGKVETTANPELTRKSMSQFEKDKLLLAESTVTDKEKSGKVRQSLEAMTKSAANADVLAKYQEIKNRKGVLLDQRV